MGSLINAFNPSQGTTGNVTDDINKICLQFVYVAIGTGIASYLEVGPCAHALCTVPFYPVSKFIPAVTVWDASKNLVARTAESRP